jgi:hypothetical protein
MIIIEHPTRGTLREWDGPPEDRSFRFSWTGQRNDPDTAHHFHSMYDAQNVLNSMSDRLRASCRIYRWDEPRLEWLLVG